MKKFYQYKNLLLILSIIGFCIFNLPFLYFLFLYPDIYRDAISNQISLVFMGEAVFILLLISFFIIKFDYKKPGALSFILLSFIGSLAFSIPFFLYLHLKKHKGK